jgi:hypothetical protein
MTVINQEFSATYGVELDAEAELFMTGAPCTEDSYGPGVYDCTTPEIPWDEGWSFKGEMSCSSDTVAGGVGPEGDWNSIRSVTLEVPETGRYYQLPVGPTRPLPVRARLAKCRARGRHSLPAHPGPLQQHDELHRHPVPSVVIAPVGGVRSPEA